jgi:hypothetical protein
MLPTKLRIMRVIRRDNHQPLRSIYRDQIFIPLHTLYIQIGSGFVQEQNGGVRANSQCQLEPLFHTRRKETNLFLTAAGQSQKLIMLAGVKPGKKGFNFA